MTSTILKNFLDCLVQYEYQDNSDVNWTLESLMDSANQTRPFAEGYLESRFFSQSPDASEDVLKGTLIHAVARLHWILNSARQEISDMFTRDEFILLLSCFQGQFMAPQGGNLIASQLCDDLGIELDEYEYSSIADLVDRLRSLNTFQTAALMDALEVGWQSGTDGFAVLEEMNLKFN